MGDSNNLQISNVDSLTLVEFIEFRFKKKYIYAVTHQRDVLNCTDVQMVAVSDEQQVLSEQPLSVERSSVLFTTICSTSK